jgi:hypothetical protein
VKYTSQRHRIAALEAALGRPGGTVLRIEGGLPKPDPMPQTREPASENCNTRVYPNGDLGSKGK